VRTNDTSSSNRWHELEGQPPIGLIGSWLSEQSIDADTLTRFFRGGTAMSKTHVPHNAHP